MLHRREGSDLVVISQPSHAWISGQLAANWGSAELGLPVPGPELRIAAEQHDIAWLDWESRPTLNHATGLPHTFMELPTMDHLGVWSNARRWSIAYGRLPALLISMHGTYLYDRFHDYESDTSDEVQAARAFLSDEKAFQERVSSGLIAERDISQQEIEVQRRLVSLWDAISLALCMGIDGARTFDSVPSNEGETDLELQRRRDHADEFAVNPWPFSRPVVELHCEGRVLDGTFEDEDRMRSALAEAPARTIAFRLLPGNGHK